MHCAKCGNRIPRGDHTICPYCGANLESNQIYSLNDEEKRKLKNMSTKRSHHLSRAGYLILIGAVFGVLGFGIAFFYPFQYPVAPALFLGALFSGVFGFLVCMISIASTLRSNNAKSRTRTKNGRVLTVYDAMSLRVYYPHWMKWWYPLIPPTICLILGYIGVIPLVLGWLLFFVYGGSLILYQYLYARRWLAKYQSQ